MIFGDLSLEGSVAFAHFNCGKLGLSLDLNSEAGSGPTANQLMQNKMMFARIKWQALAIVVVAVLMAASK